MPLQESRPTEDPADLIFMEPDLLVEHPADEAYCIAQGRAVNAVKIFRGTHPDAIYLSKEIKNLAIPPHRRIADIIKVPLPPVSLLLDALYTLRVPGQCLAHLWLQSCTVYERAWHMPSILPKHRDFFPLERAWAAREDIERVSGSSRLPDGEGV